MFELKYILILALCSFLGVCEGQIVQNGQCDPNIALVENFNLAMFLGTWHEIRRSSSPEQNSDCASFNITVSDDTINIHHRGVNDNFLEDSRGTATLSSGLAKLTLDISMFDGPMDFWVLLTDYATFAVTYSCENISSTQRSIYLWILGRGKVYPNELVPAYISTILNTLLGIDFYSLKTLDHSEEACYVLPSFEPGQNIVLPEQCDSNVPVVENFKMSDYAGLWYIIEAYPEPFLTGTCSKADYRLNDDDTIHIENIQVVDRLLAINNGSAIIVADDGSAKLDITFNFDGDDVTTNYWVLITDYDSYALVYSCQNIDTDFKSVFSWKLSRTPSLTATADTAINTVINSIQDLNQRYYVKKGHTEEDCFYYPENNGGDVLLPGQCPDESAIPAVTNFDANLFSGTWYEIARYPSETQQGECVATEYAMSESNTVTITHAAVLNERQNSTIMQATVSSDGRGIIRINEAAFNNIYILATDYTEYALAYTCRNINEELKQIYSWKLSRSRSDLSAAANTVINQHVSDNIDLWDGYYRTTSQDYDACFYYPEFDDVPPYIEMPGPCPDTIRGVPNFNANAYLGQWFEIARYPVVHQVGQCSRAEYSLAERILISNTEVAELTLMTQSGYADVTTDGNGYLNVEFIVDGEVKTANYSILATDYTSYSLVYSCTNTTDGNSRVSSWKLSRTPYLTLQAAYTMTSVIGSTKGLTEEYYQTTSQTDEECFYLPSVNINEAPVFKGQCESITGIEGFDAQRYLGWWHEIERYPTDGTNGDCRSSEYILDGNTYKVVDTDVQNNEGVFITGTVTITSDGRLRRIIPGRPDQDILVLATDYETYALLYSCENVNNEYRRVWSAKHSKLRSLTATAQNAMAPFIASNRVLYEQFYLSVDQSDEACFYYPTIIDDQIIIPGQCDSAIPVVQNFHAVDFAGTWYQTERYDEIKGSCVGSKYSIDSGSISVLNYEVRDGKLQVVEGLAKIISTDGSAKIELTSAVATTTTTLSILATDYTSYALAYSCNNVNEFQRQVRAWILSRDRTLSAEATTAINNLIQQRQELHQPYFKQIEQNDECPEPSSALIIKSSIIVVLVCALLQWSF